MKWEGFCGLGSSECGYGYGLELMNMNIIVVVTAEVCRQSSLFACTLSHRAHDPSLLSAPSLHLNLTRPTSIMRSRRPYLCSLVS